MRALRYEAIEFLRLASPGCSALARRDGNVRSDTRFASLKRGDGEKPSSGGFALRGWCLSADPIPAKAGVVQAGENPAWGVQATTRFHTARRVKFPLRLVQPIWRGELPNW
jgi:hypothetical protein